MAEIVRVDAPAILEPGEVDQPRRWQPFHQLRLLLADLALIARSLAGPFIDAWTNRDYRLETAAHNTAMHMEEVHAQVYAAYLFVHQPRYWRGETYHQEAVIEFQKMTKGQAQDFLKEFDAQYRRALRRLQNESGVDLGR